MEDTDDMANSMNHFFSNIGVKLCNDIPDTENNLLNGDYDSTQQKPPFCLHP